MITHAPAALRLGKLMAQNQVLMFATKRLQRLAAFVGPLTPLGRGLQELQAAALISVIDENTRPPPPFASQQPATILDPEVEHFFRHGHEPLF